MKDKKQIFNIIFVVLFFVISVIPLIFFSDKQPLIGNENRAEKKDVDAYFSQNFGFRNNLVYAGNMLKKLAFKTSGQSDVIIGEDGWLFYASALEDFLGTNMLSDIYIEKITSIIKMMQDMAKDNGCEFAFFVAPNKMSVYGEYMPYYYKESLALGNYEKLYAQLVNEGVCTVNLKNILSYEKLKGTRLYHKLDSHWNNLGASVAYENIMKTMGMEYTEYSKMDYSVKYSHSGDLLSMLLPQSTEKDEQFEFETDENFEYTSRFKGVDDMVISTINEKPVNDNAVTLFRDSFGNALYWFFANDFAVLNAKRELPYNMYKAVKEGDVIVVEIVERNIVNLLKYTPIIVSKNVAEEFKDIIKDNSSKEKLKENTSCINTETNIYLATSMTADGLLKMEISGLPDTAKMYIAYNDEKIYQLIPGFDEGCYVLYLMDEDIADMVGIFNDANEGNMDLADKLYFIYMEDNGEIIYTTYTNVTLQD